MQRDGPWHVPWGAEGAPVGVASRSVEGGAVEREREPVILVVRLPLGKHPPRRGRRDVLRAGVGPVVQDVAPPGADREPVPLAEPVAVRVDVDPDGRPGALERGDLGLQGLDAVERLGEVLGGDLAGGGGVSEWRLSMALPSKCEPVMTPSLMSG